VLNRTVEEFARHYGMVVLPARVRKPQDKAKVEVSVQIVQRWILARLRRCRFFSLQELNVEIARLLRDLNKRVSRIGANIPFFTNNLSIVFHRCA